MEQRLLGLKDVYKIANCGFLGQWSCHRFFENCLLFLHVLHFFVYAIHGWSFVLVKGITTVMVLRHLLYAHLTNFEFVGVAWAQVTAITSRTSFNLRLCVIFYNLSQKYYYS